MKVLNVTRGIFEGKKWCKVVFSGDQMTGEDRTGVYVKEIKAQYDLYDELAHACKNQTEVMPRCDFYGRVSMLDY